MKGLYNAAHFAEEVLRELHRPSLVTVDDGYLLVHDPEQCDSTYEIPVSDMRDATRALEWVRQLAEKRWVTRQVIVDFANAALDSTEVRHG